MNKLKIFVITTCFAFVSNLAIASESRIGISGAFTTLDSSGTETVKSSSAKKNKDVTEDVVVPSIFVEVVADSGFALGLDFVPGSAELGSGTRTDDDEETTGNNKASADLSEHITLYGLYPVGDNGVYLKGGIAFANIETTEVLATGSKYEDERVTGIVVGAGVSRDLDNGMFVRAEATYSDYDEISLKSQADAEGNQNKIDADVSAIALRVSFGKSF